MTPVLPTSLDFSRDRAIIRALPEVPPRTNGVHLAWEQRLAVEHSASGAWRCHLPTL